jgi:HEAT repeat protein
MMRTRFGTMLAVGTAFGLMATLSGCPDNPYDADTWIEKLDDPKEFDRAVTELEHLCNPKAIPALGRAWERNSKPQRVLQVIIDLAQKLTPEQADQKNCTDYMKKGRDAAWDLALPILKNAIDSLELGSQRSIDGAVKAAEALGDAQIPDGVPILIDAVNRKMNPKDNAQRVRLTAIAALGKYKDKSAVVTLANVIRADASSQPPAVVGAAINALGEMKTGDAIPVLLESMYRAPLFFTQVRRALVASGPEVAPQLRRILKHEHPEVNELFKEKKLDKYCGDDGKAKPEECQDVAAMDYYAAIVLGDLRDVEGVPVLIEALKRKPTPAYFSNYNAGPPATNSVLDALRKIGSADAAGAVLAIAADPKADERLRGVALSVYGFVSKDGSEKTGTTTGIAFLRSIAEKNDASEVLRLPASESYARLARTKEQMAPLKALADKYAKASKEARAKADGDPKKAFDAANAKFEAAKTAYDEAKKELDKAKAAAGGDVAKVDPEILNKTTATKKAFDETKEKVYKPAKEAYDSLDQQAKGYTGYQRGFENHMARIAIAMQCGDKVECYVATLTAEPAAVFDSAKSYLDVGDGKGWSDDDKLELKVAQIERAMLELRRMGTKASSALAPLLDTKTTNAVKSEDRLIRQSILLALPAIAPKPCNECVTALDQVIKVGQGRQELQELTYETQIARSYFAAMGGVSAEAPAPAEAPAAAGGDK